MVQSLREIIENRFQPFNFSEPESSEDINVDVVSLGDFGTEPINMIFEDSNELDLTPEKALAELGYLDGTGF